jgi:hypothetical protein
MKVFYHAFWVGRKEDDSSLILPRGLSNYFKNFMELKRG